MLENLPPPSVLGVLVRSWAYWVRTAPPFSPSGEIACQSRCPWTYGGVKRGSVELIPLPVLWAVGWFLFAGLSNMGVTRCGEGVSFNNPPFFAGGLVTRTGCGLLFTSGKTCCRFGGYPLPLVPGFKTDWLSVSRFLLGRVGECCGAGLVFPVPGAGLVGGALAAGVLAPGSRCCALFCGAGIGAVAPITCACCVRGCGR